MEPLLAVLLGLVCFACLLRPGIVNPTELDWLRQDDAAQHLIGLHCFVREPWQWPPAAFSSYGDGVRTSVVFTDSVPLLALPWKAALRAFGITEILQPFGLFMALGFALEAFFGFRLLKHLSGDRWIGFLGVPFFLVCPVLLFRLPMHLALGGQWLILWALWLAVRPGAFGWKRNAEWLAMLALALGIHFYIWIMGSAFYGAALLAAGWRRGTAWSRCALYGAVFLATVAVGGWLWGYFIPVDARGADYGVMKFNLLGFFNPLGWSRWIPGAVWGPGEYEGIAWPGAGLLALALVVSFFPTRFPTAERAARAWRSPCLLAMLTALTAVAITPQVNLGPLGWGLSVAVALGTGAGMMFWIQRKGLNRWLREVSPLILLTALLAFSAIAAVSVLFLVPANSLDLVRASGRMIWPAFFWFACWVVVRTGHCFRRPLALALLGVGVCVQVYDIAPKIGRIRRDVLKPGGLSEQSCDLGVPGLTAALWKLCDGKERLWIIAKPGDLRQRNALGLLAIQKSLSVNRPYLARSPKESLQRHEAEILDTFRRGIVPPGVVYLVFPEMQEQATALVTGQGGALEHAEAGGYTVVTGAKFR